MTTLRWCGAACDLNYRPHIHVTSLTCMWPALHACDPPYMHVTSLTCMWPALHACDTPYMHVTSLTCMWPASLHVTSFTCMWPALHACDQPCMHVTSLTCMWPASKACDQPHMHVTSLIWMWPASYACGKHHVHVTSLTCLWPAFHECDQVWHMPHGVTLLATPRNNDNCCLIFEQPSSGHFHTTPCVSSYLCSPSHDLLASTKSTHCYFSPRSEGTLQDQKGSEALLLVSIRDAFLTTYALLPSHLSEDSHYKYFKLLILIRSS